MPPPGLKVPQRRTFFYLIAETGIQQGSDSFEISNRDFDVQKGNPFAPLHPVVQFFWDEVESWSDEQRALLLLWCTGSSRPPARGFDRLLGRDGRERKFTITSAPLARAAYPRAHTCFNRVDLPLFGSREDLARAFDVALAAEHAAFSMD